MPSNIFVRSWGNSIIDRFYGIEAYVILTEPVLAGQKLVGLSAAKYTLTARGVVPWRIR